MGGVSGGQTLLGGPRSPSKRYRQERCQASASSAGFSQVGMRAEHRKELGDDNGVRWGQGRRELPAQEAKVARFKEVKDKATWLGVVMTDLRESTVPQLCGTAWQ